MKRALNILCALIFALFAYWNLNDPDAWLWVSAYGLTALFFALAALGRADRRVSGLLCVVLCVWALTMVPGMLDWIDADMPSITDEMKATSPHIEVVREFLGLSIAALALVFLVFSTPKTARLF